MNDKIQELTDKLYSQGLAKGKAEGERLVEDARKQAEIILEEARTEAAKIISDAENSASLIKSKAESDVRIASEQTITVTKHTIENLLIEKICNAPVTAGTADSDFLKSIITEVASRFSAQESQPLDIILPLSLKDSLEPWVRNELSKNLGSGIGASFSSKIKGGFKIGPKDGGWLVSFTDETLKELIGEYLRPVTRKILFGE